MSIAWQWSIRAIRALQILAEEWTVVATGQDVSSLRNNSKKQEKYSQPRTDTSIGPIEDHQAHDISQSINFLSSPEGAIFPSDFTATVNYTPGCEQWQMSQQPLETNIDWIIAYNTGDFMDGSMDETIFSNELLDFNLHDISHNPQAFTSNVSQ
jgi:hypothetical protein